MAAVAAPGRAISLTDRLGPESQVVLVEPRRVRDRAVELHEEEGALGEALAATWGAGDGGDGAGQFPRLYLPFDRLLSRSRSATLSMVPVAEGPDVPAVTVRGFEPVAGDAGRLARQVTSLAEERLSVTLCSATAGGAARLTGVLAEEGVTAQAAVTADAGSGIRVVAAPVATGFVVPHAGVAVLSESDVTGRRTPHRTARPRPRPTDGFFDDLAPGSYVVHRQHGVARYAGVTTRAVGGTSRDYLVLEYRGSDRLYLPVDQIEAVTPYSGGESPTLSRMGGADWQRTRARARAAAAEVAEDLVDLYRRRLSVAGHAFPPETPWEQELAGSFAYVETPDQLRAIADVKTDMELPRPMDRLICGDVGFGKTEVAVRAVFKAVQDGRQAAVLVPTTLLASQHFQTFSERLASFPVRVELLSRFLSAAQARKVVEGLADGSVDLVVGTHRLLAQDVVFKNLGLLAVDEEQRFGVSHKEAVKRLAEGVDVLTLTASPIPRTLEMALTGIRDLSMVNTPPADRQPILTYVGEYDEAAVSEALRRELLREGQVFFVHNRVADIDAVARRLRALVPEARIAVAHGQMDEGSLEQVVLDFWERRYDVLVCTTIIESGIDMPTVNTLVVDRADLLGLGQLHQLRGRVGRAGRGPTPTSSIRRTGCSPSRPTNGCGPSGSTPRWAPVSRSPCATSRSGAPATCSDPTSRATSPPSATTSTCSWWRRRWPRPEVSRGPSLRRWSLDVPGDAHLPASYVPAEDARLEAYRRLAAAASQADVDDVGEEWADRYGPRPSPAEGLLALARLRVECLRIGITEVSVVPARVGGARQAVARLAPLTLPASAQVRLRRLAPGAIFREELHQLVVELPAGEPAAEVLRALLVELVPPPAKGSLEGTASPVTADSGAGGPTGSMPRA